MSIYEEIIEVLSAEDSIKDIYANKLQNVKLGREESVGLCPFHNDHTPSLTFSNKNGLYICFSCGAKGNLFQFLSDVDGESIPSVIKELCEMTGVEYRELSEVVIGEKYVELTSIAENFMKVAHETLLNDSGAQDYLLNKRGMTLEDIKKYDIGYVQPNQFAPNQFTEKLGLSKNNYSLMDDAIIYPSRTLIDYHNLPSGTIVGFSIKPLDKSTKNSYSVNIDFDGEKFNGFGIASKRFNTSKGLIIVEGAADALAYNMVNYNGSIATLGSKVSDKRFTSIAEYVLRVKCPVFIAYDNDKAGLDGTRSLIDKFIEFNNSFGDLEIDLRFIKLEKDSDEYIVDGQKQELEDAIDKSQPCYYDLAERTNYTNGDEIHKLAMLGKLSTSYFRKLQERDFQSRTNGMSFSDFVQVHNPFNENVENPPSLMDIIKSEEKKTNKLHNKKFVIAVLKYFKDEDRDRYEELLVDLDVPDEIINKIENIDFTPVTSRFQADLIVKKLFRD